MSNKFSLLWSHIGAWAQSLRLKTLLVTVSPLVIVYKILVEEPNFDLKYFFAYFLGCLGFQIACNFTNEYYDYLRGVDNQARKGPIRMLQKKYITLEQMKLAIAITFFLSFVVVIYLALEYGLGILLIALLSGLAAFFYTGGKYPYGYWGLGEIMAFLFFGPVIVFIPFSLVYPWPALFAKPVAFLIALGAGCFAWSLISINSLRDYENDAKNKKMTLAVILGKKWWKPLLLLLLITGNVLLYLVISHDPAKGWFLVNALLVLILSILIIKEVKLNQALGLTSLNYFYTSIVVYFLY